MRGRGGFRRAGAHFLVWEEDARDGTEWAAELAAAENSRARLQGREPRRVGVERDVLAARQLAIDCARRVTRSG